MIRPPPKKKKTANLHSHRPESTNWLTFLHSETGSDEGGARALGNHVSFLSRVPFHHFIYGKTEEGIEIYIAVLNI